MYPAARYFWVHGERINALNEGLRTFKEELNRDSLLTNESSCNCHI